MGVVWAGLCVGLLGWVKLRVQLVMRLVESEDSGELRAYGTDEGATGDGFGEESGRIGGGRGHDDDGDGDEGIVVIQNNDRR
jgi:hypothetical protein